MRGRQSIRVLVAEPFALTSEVICRALTAPGIEVVGKVTDGRTVVSRIRSSHPDVVVLDGMLGYRNRTDLIAQVKAGRRPPKIVILADHADPVYQEAALASGADKVVLKVRLIQELLPAIRSALGR